MNKEQYIQEPSRIKPFLSDYVSEITKTTKVKNQYICPLCNSGTGKNGTGAFTIYPESNSYYCFSCGRGGDIITLFSAVNNVDFKTGINQLSEKYGISRTAQVCAVPAPAEKNYTKLFIYSESNLANTDYLTKRGIPIEIQQKFHCGFIPDFKYDGEKTTPAVIIPTSDTSFMWRSTTENIKQKRGKAHIFNQSALNLNNPYCFVVEGEIDCISVYSCGYNFPCIATGSVSNIKKIFDNDLKNTVLIIAMDNDGAGQKATRELEKLCTEHGTPFITAPDIWSDCKDCNELLIKNREKLTENLKRYATQAKNFDFAKFSEQLKEMNICSPAPDVSPVGHEKPIPFEKSEKLPDFPLNALPDVLREYLKAVCEFVQIPPEMAVLPLLSVLAMCVQGKALVKHPFNSHTQPLNLYAITAAPPGSRKSCCLHEFLKPVEDFQKEYNERHTGDIEKYKTELAFLERQRNNAINGKSPDLQQAKDIAQQIANLQPVNELILNIGDVTPEALAFELSQQGEKMGIIDDEGGIFDILSGLYSSRTPNIDIFLKGYDGSQYNVLRRGAGNIILNCPTLTVGLMTQPEKLAEAMQNKQFMSRGLMHRFLFAFPENLEKISISSLDIPEDLTSIYNSVIKILLERPKEKLIPVMQFEENTKDLFINYFNRIEQLKKQSEAFPDFQDWLSKHFSRSLRIAGILHLWENASDKKINAQTVQRAIWIATWAEEQAKKALCESITECDEDKNAKYVLEKIKGLNLCEITKRELMRKCRKLSQTEYNETLEILTEMNYISLETIQTVRKPKEIVKVNPEILKIT